MSRQPSQRSTRPRRAADRATFVGRGGQVQWRLIDRNGRHLAQGMAPTLEAAKAEAAERLAELQRPAPADESPVPAAADAAGPIEPAAPAQEE